MRCSRREHGEDEAEMERERETSAEPHVTNRAGQIEERCDDPRQRRVETASVKSAQGADGERRTELRRETEATPGERDARVPRKAVTRALSQGRAYPSTQVSLGPRLIAVDSPRACLEEQIPSLRPLSAWSRT
ncbi:unnamed protein product [Arctogadus glacialis]